MAEPQRRKPFSLRGGSGSAFSAGFLRREFERNMR